jgi:hypothetical protein
VLDEVVLDIVLDVESNGNGIAVCGECQWEGTTEWKRMMMRLWQSDNAMAGNVDNENFHLQRMEQQQAVQSGRGGYCWEGGCKEITTSRKATLCNA